MGVVGGHEKRWAILGVMSLSLIIVMFNNVTLNVALPELSKDLSADNTELQWILDAYALIFGGTLLVMGALGDRFGRKPALQIGLLLDHRCLVVDCKVVEALRNLAAKLVDRQRIVCLRPVRVHDSVLHRPLM